MDLVIAHVSKDYGRGPVLRDVSLTVRQGETVCLMGPSGLGKTTLLRCIAGLETPDAGAVTGVPRRLGYVFQEDRLCDSFSAVANIRLVTGRTLPEKAILQHLEELGLSAPIQAGLRLGEGSGAVCFLPLLDMALAVYGEMSTFDQIEELSRLKGRLGGVPTGLYDLDRMLTGLHGGELVLVGARPAMGKTSMALGVTLFAAQKAHKCVAFFSLEMPAEQIGLRLLCSAANINMQRVRSGMLSDEEWVKLGDSINALSNCRIYIDDTSGLTPSQLRSRCRRLMMEQGLDLVVLDYLGLMGTDKRVENRQLEVSEISRQLKSIALELKIPVLACAQLSRANASRENKRPMLSDLRDSGSIEQDADVVMFLHREGYYAAAGGPEDGPKPDDNQGEIIVAKQRNGPIGTVNVEWQAEFARYTNLPGTRVAVYAD